MPPQAYASLEEIAHYEDPTGAMQLLRVKDVASHHPQGDCLEAGGYRGVAGGTGGEGGVSIAGHSR